MIQKTFDIAKVSSLQNGDANPLLSKKTSTNTHIPFYGSLSHIN
ncbi:hypothetical protein PAUR_a0208 [Pseudoalteromonas aurantia 208]|uniref:Orphan protein n=1 Tax=Pseudoalteromonas aurantia 208 TaxID=1314867 RepID=A0ABR9E7G6_9GAMM|nr:hypothetical protein [Pseudoalteromonas aurantia 208]